MLKSKVKMLRKKRLQQPRKGFGCRSSKPLLSLPITVHNYNSKWQSPYSQSRYLTVNNQQDNNSWRPDIWSIGNCVRQGDGTGSTHSNSSVVENYNRDYAQFDRHHFSHTVQQTQDELPRNYSNLSMKNVNSPLQMKTDNTNDNEEAILSHFLSQKQPGATVNWQSIDMIIPGLYISDLVRSTDSDTLRLYGINHIVRCIHDTEVKPDIEMASRLARNIDLLVPVLDRPKVDISSFFAPAINFIHRARLKNRIVLVHCMQGRSRSAAIVMAYLIVALGLDTNQAFLLVKMRRACTKPNNGFLRQLRQLQTEANAMHHRVLCNITGPNLELTSNDRKNCLAEIRKTLSS